MDAVLWSLAYRTNPIEDVHLVPHRGGVQGAQYGPKTSDSGLLIDATPQISDGAARAADAQIHGARARAVGGARPVIFTSSRALGMIRGCVDRGVELHDDRRAAVATLPRPRNETDVKSGTSA